MFVLLLGPILNFLTSLKKQKETIQKPDKCQAIDQPCARNGHWLKAGSLYIIFNIQLETRIAPLFLTLPFCSVYIASTVLAFIVPKKFWPLSFFNIGRYGD
jgi:hypothetical protein